MTPIVPDRLTAEHTGPIVVFLIGLRINRLLRVDKWLPTARAMQPMIAELAADPDSGFLGAETALIPMRTVMMLQYWRDFDSLEAYAKARDKRHWPAWTEFNRRIGTDGTVGIFHETYVVDAGRYETIYVNMPKFGLGALGTPVQATGSRKEARSRMRGDMTEAAGDAASEDA